MAAAKKPAVKKVTPKAPKIGPALARRNAAEQDWSNRYSGWDLGTLPTKAHREADAIKADYQKAVNAEKTRVATANAKKSAPKTLAELKRADEKRIPRKK